jgi:hypothetical protein
VQSISIFDPKISLRRLDPLHLDRRLWCIALCFVAFATPARANTFFSLDHPFSWLTQLLQISLFRIFDPPAAAMTPVSTIVPESPKVALAPAVPSGPCSVSPVPPINDDEAKTFEAASGTSGVVDLNGLTPATAIALQRFESRVASLGGSVSVKSAYRPPAYQAHLQVIWDKHMRLRNSRESGCAVLKAQVDDDFNRHQLLESQRPVNRSDHTRGIGFDAAVTPGLKMPLDRVARLAGVLRPDMWRDPVHYRLIAQATRPARSGRTARPGRRR